jgi:hypothetical protein
VGVVAIVLILLFAFRRKSRVSAKSRSYKKSKMSETEESGALAV